MIRFLDGPAGGQTLMLQRAPLLLRVVQSKSGKWDALDKTEDEAARGEEIFVYRRDGDANPVHIKMTGPGSGFYLMAKYNYWRGHPPTEYLARNRVWRTWALLHSYTPVPPLIEHPRL
jgi:hypothetical protein